MTESQTTTSPSEATPTSASQATVTNNNRSGSGGNQNPNANNSNPIVDKNFAGATPEVKAVMGLIFEKNMTDRKSYTNFKMTIMTYINKMGSVYKHTTYLQRAFDRDLDPISEWRRDEPHLSMPASGLELDIPYKDKYTWETKSAAHWAKETQLETTCRAAFNLMWGQLTPGLQSMIMAHTDYKAAATSCNCLWLLERIKIESSCLDTKGNKRVNFFVLLLRLFNFKQGKKMTNDDYYNTFLEHAASLEAAGGEGIFCNTDIMKAFKLDPLKLDDVEKECEAFKAIMFLLHSNAAEYGDLLNRLENNAIIGQDGYPTTVTDAYHLLNRELLSNLRKRGRPNPNPNQNRTSTGNLMFFQHMLNTPLGKAVQFVQIICSTWVLLDTCSTCCVTNNKSFVTNVTDCDDSNKLTLHTNGGLKDFDEVGMFTLFPLQMHVNCESMATVLSFHLLQKVKVYALCMIWIKMMYFMSHTMEKDMILAQGEVVCTILTPLVHLCRSLRMFLLQIRSVLWRFPMIVALILVLLVIN